jgi:hypothetical protein
MVIVLVGQPMRMLGRRLQRHQVHHVDHSNYQVKGQRAQQNNGGQRLQRQRPLQQRVVFQIDLAHGEIVGGAPVGVHLD